MIGVYHANEPTSKVDLPQMHKDFHEGKFTHVADVMTNNKDAAFHLTNNIGFHWSMNQNVYPFVKGHKSRSTSVGDIFVCADAMYAVTNSGFQILHQFD